MEITYDGQISFSRLFSFKFHWRITTSLQSLPSGSESSSNKRPPCEALLQQTSAEEAQQIRLNLIYPLWPVQQNLHRTSALGRRNNSTF